MREKTLEYNEYCHHCGGILIRVPKPAETLESYTPWGGFPLGSRFNSETGLRQFGIVVKCPKARWWNNHTEYVDENSLHDSDLPELTK